MHGQQNIKFEIYVIIWLINLLYMQSYERAVKSIEVLQQAEDIAEKLLVQVISMRLFKGHDATSERRWQRK